MQCVHIRWHIRPRKKNSLSQSSQVIWKLMQYAIFYFFIFFLFGVQKGGYPKNSLVLIHIHLTTGKFSLKKNENKKNSRISFWPNLPISQTRAWALYFLALIVLTSVLWIIVNLMVRIFNFWYEYAVPEFLLCCSFTICTWHSK